MIWESFPTGQSSPGRTDVENKQLHCLSSLPFSVSSFKPSTTPFPSLFHCLPLSLPLLQWYLNTSWVTVCPFTLLLPVQFAALEISARTISQSNIWSTENLYFLTNLKIYFSFKLYQNLFWLQILKGEETKWTWCIGRHIFYRWHSHLIILRINQ